MELESPTAILDRMEHTEAGDSRRPPVVLAVIPNLLSAAWLVLGLAFAAVPVSWRLVVVVVAGATEFLDGGAETPVGRLRRDGLPTRPNRRQGLRAGRRVSGAGGLAMR